jgi:N-acetylglucosamine kinase-like BadF-type ATPase
MTAGAGFAREVAAAARDGDETAVGIWRAAGEALAATAAAAGQRVFGNGRPFDVSTAGGLFHVGPLLLEAFEAALRRHPPASTLRTPKGDGLDGSFLLAAKPGLPHAGLTFRPL